MGTLYYGDNLDILKRYLKDETVDLVYLDPPFNSNASYNVLFKAPDGHESHAQMEAFAEFYSLRSAFRRLHVWPLKSRAWVANMAIWKGIRYYHGRKGRRVPTFADFQNPDSPAWNYPDEAWARGPQSKPQAVASAE